MPVEKSAGAVIFRRESRSKTTSLQGKNSKIYYLLLHYKLGHWGFPKGIIEKGEKLQETIKREVREETGIRSIEFIPGFQESIRYVFRLGDKTIFKIATFFLAESKEKEVKISQEHVGFQWLAYQDAFEQISFKNAKEILKKAHCFLRQ